MEEEQVIEELRLSFNNQYKPSFENLDLFIDYLYGGCFNEIYNELTTGYKPQTKTDTFK